MRKHFGPTKYPREKILDQRNTHEKKFRTHEIPTGKKLRPTKYPRQKFETHKIPTGKYFGPTKYPRGKFSDQRRHDGTRYTRTTMAQDSRNLAHSRNSCSKALTR